MATAASPCNPRGGLRFVVYPNDHPPAHVHGRRARGPPRHRGGGGGAWHPFPPARRRPLRAGAAGGRARFATLDGGAARRRRRAGAFSGQGGGGAREWAAWGGAPVRSRADKRRDCSTLALHMQGSDRPGCCSVTLPNRPVGNLRSGVSAMALTDDRWRRNGIRGHLRTFRRNAEFTQL